MIQGETRPIRRARVRMTRGGRKGRKATIRVAMFEARIVVDETLEMRAATRARDRRGGRMPHHRRPDEERAKERADRRAYRRRAAARVED